MDKSQEDHDFVIKFIIDRVVPDDGTVYSEGDIEGRWLGESSRTFNGSYPLRWALIEEATAIIDMALEYLGEPDE